ncbi:hypothetical protein GCM10022247_14980 [Allokutzneria multivorans]|uniref:Uncharacterized protein n=1 Tax=Allokutzneria multivorans TaxID=1142134 RepID=A0ABP7RDU7_9PSEU
MEGGAAGQLGAVEQHDIAFAQFGEVVGDARAADATADHDDAGAGGELSVRGHTPFVPACRARGNALTQTITRKTLDGSRLGEDAR